MDGQYQSHSFLLKTFNKFCANSSRRLKLSAIGGYMPSPINPIELIKLKTFFGNTDDFLTGAYLDGNELLVVDGSPNKRRFTNLLPVKVSGLRLRAGGHAGTSETFFTENPDFDGPSLRLKAELNASSANYAKAYGCLRLLHSFQRYYREKRLVQEEVSLIREALQNLRRGISTSISSLCYELLQYHVRHDILNASWELGVTKGKILLAAELTSWLNEQGHAEEASPLFAELNSLIRSRRFVFSPAELSTFFRQRAHNVMDGHAGPTVRYLLESAADTQDNTPHNDFATITSAVPFELQADNPKPYYEKIEGSLAKFNKLTDSGFGSLNRQITGISVPTALGVIALGSFLSQRVGRATDDPLPALRHQSENGAGGVKFVHNESIRAMLTVNWMKGRPHAGYFLSCMLPYMPDELAVEVKRSAAILLELSGG